MQLPLLNRCDVPVDHRAMWVAGLLRGASAQAARGLTRPSATGVPLAGGRPRTHAEIVSTLLASLLDPQEPWSVTVTSEGSDVTVGLSYAGEPVGDVVRPPLDVPWRYEAAAILTEIAYLPEVDQTPLAARLMCPAHDHPLAPTVQRGALLLVCPVLPSVTVRVVIPSVD